MRTMPNEELKDILAKHKKWLYNGEGGEKADLREVDLRGANLKYADLRGANLRGTNLRGTNVYGADLRSVRRPWLFYTDNIGSRRSKTLYFADYDNIRCGCWNNYIGGTLAEFKERVDEVYPADDENKICQRYRIEYLGAIKMFESMREAYLKQGNRGED